LKISKTSGGGSVSKTGYGPKPPSTSERKQQVEPIEITDTVSLSPEAIAAAKAEAADQVEGLDGTFDGPLPDPRETSRAMLRKELERVFGLIYL
jgi:hypothetical protein